MKNITTFIFCVFLISIGTAQQPLNGGGSTRLTANGDVTGASSDELLLGQGVSPSVKNLSRLFGFGSIYNGYNNSFNANQTKKNLHDQLSTRWNRATFVGYNGFLNSISARYNSLTDEIEINDNGNIYKFIKKDNLAITFTDSNKTYVAKSYINDNGEETISYFIKDEDMKDSRLLKKETFSYHTSNNGLIVVKEEDFYLVRGKALVSISLDRKAIKESFPEQSKSILAFIRKNDIKDKDNGLVVLANYINTLDSDKNYGTSLASNKP